jgi:hypothetical protein
MNRIALACETGRNEAHFDRRSAQPVQQQNADLAALDLETHIPRHVIIPNDEIRCPVRGLKGTSELGAAAL